MQAPESEPRFQFKLRSLFIAMLGLAICIVNWQSLLELSVGYFYLFAGLFMVAPWWFAQRLRNPLCVSSAFPRSSLWYAALLIATITCVASIWIRHRWITSSADVGWPRSLPYPDEMLLTFHDWLDARNPVEPGFFKIHGEFYTVLLYLHLAALSACAFVGALCGFVFPPFVLAGFARCREKVAVWRRKAITK